MAEHPKSVVIFAVGNPSRGDDALGPQLMAWLSSRRRRRVRLVEDFQLQVEHALDLDGADLALFVDAGTGTPAPFSFSEIEPLASRAVSSHALSPEAVLQVFRDVFQRSPPPAFVLCIRGEQFDLGAPLSAAARARLDAAIAFLPDLLEQRDAIAWRRFVDTRLKPQPAIVGGDHTGAATP